MLFLINSAMLCSLHMPYGKGANESKDDNRSVVIVSLHLGLVWSFGRLVGVFSVWRLHVLPVSVFSRNSAFLQQSNIMTPGSRRNTKTKTLQLLGMHILHRGLNPEPSCKWQICVFISGAPVYSHESKDSVQWGQLKLLKPSKVFLSFLAINQESKMSTEWVKQQKHSNL